MVILPDSALTREVTELVRDTEGELLFNHSSRVYCFGALAGAQRELTFDHELLYVGAMFHDMGLLPPYASDNRRFEVDSANAARDFLKRHKIAEQDIKTVWTAIALHTTPGIPEYMDPLIALVTAGVEMDVLGIGFDHFPAEQRDAIVKAFPRDAQFKRDIINAFYEGNKHKSESTFGNVNADVLAYKDPNFKPLNFCSLICHSKWPGNGH